ncbi:MAG TPA: hypothetical protein VFM79_12875 [Pelobium sp.]|nr:hypothetical protein [Pelobium sp.]
MKYLLLLICFISCDVVFAQNNAQQLISSSKADTWVATDALKRDLTVNAQNGEIREDKFVGIFYFVWQGAHGYDEIAKPDKDDGVKAKLPRDTISPYDISKLLKENPENPNYGPLKAFHHWGEPYFGYYLPDDEWIIRKHAQMLSDAGVDVLIIDVTNASIYLPQVTKIVEIYRKMRKQGISTPSFSFIVNSNPTNTVNRLYQSIYKPGLFKDLWFYWKGKPLLLTPPEGLTDENRDFFTAKQSWAWTEGQEWFGNGKDKWPWLDHTPQNYGWTKSKDQPEQISVAVAEHPISNIGRSFHDGKQPEVHQSGKGLYFEEQWKRALEVDPEFVFVTGWNEWVAMRFNDWKTKKFMGKPIKMGDTYFVDLYNAEYSRDAEPMKGEFTDNYYYQLVDNIRKFKGSRNIPTYSSTNSIKVDANFSDWQNVEAVFTDDEGDILHRNHPGWGRIKSYVNTSGRNDITDAKVSSDKDHLFFYVKTKNNLTPFTDKNWMQLYISLNGNQPNWEGFQYMIKHPPDGKNKASLLKYNENGTWVSNGLITVESSGNEMELKIPKSMLLLVGNKFTLDFKWTDNIETGDPLLWLDQGDTAPNARFKYRYQKTE